MTTQLDLFGWAPPAAPPEPGSTLLEILGDGDGIKLKRIDHNTKENTAELRLLAKISQLLDRSLHRFADNLNTWMRNTSVGNHANFLCFYKVKFVDEHTAEVWHFTLQGDLDRHVCTIINPTAI